MIERDLQPQSVLSDEELERGSRFKFQRDRQLFYARRILLRRLLELRTGIPAAQLEYATSPQGKLSLVEDAQAFNLSASQAGAAFAFCRSGPVGIDLEQVRPLDDLAGMLARVCSPAEQDAISNLPAALHLDAFFHIWTQKEATLKTLGSGFLLEPASVTVEADPRKPGRLFAAPGVDSSGWKLITLTPKPDWRIAVCVQMTGEPRVVFSVEN